MLRMLTRAATVAGFLAIGMTLGAPAKAAEVTLRLHTFIPPVANPAKAFLIPWMEKINKDSNGRIEVKPFWAMQLGGKPPQLLDQVRDGVVDIVWVLPGFATGRMPRVEAFELPFVHTDPVSTTLALQDFQEKYLADELKDYHPLLLHCHAGELLMTKDPVGSLDDLKNMKIRGANRSAVWFLQALGADAIGAPLGEIPQMLSKGTIDGAMLPYEIAPAVKMQDLVNNFTELEGPQQRLSTAVFTFLMNKNSYEKLPDDLKKVIDDNSGRNIAEMAGKIWVQIEEPGLAAMKSKSKNKFATLPAAEVEKMRAKSGEVYTRWFDEMKSLGIDGKALLDDAKAMIAKYKK